MIFGKFLVLLFFICEFSFYLVRGQTNNQEKSDCTKIYNIVNGDSKNYYDNCCKDNGIKCDNEGYIIYFDSYEFTGSVNLTTFPYLPRIEELQTDSFDLEKITKYILNLTSLKSLSIYHNYLEIIPPGIQNLSKLEELCIYDNFIKELPIELFKLTNLKRLDLESNFIEIIPPEIKNLAQLEFLYLDFNEIKEIPKEIFDLTHLKTLDLSGNHIEIIMPAIQNLSKLEKLNLSLNNIKEFPKEIYNLSNLRELSFNKNNIEVILPAIKSLSKLEKLNLNENNIKELPNELYKLMNLNHLDFGGNHIEVIPSAIQNLSKLEKLDFGRNHIEVIPSTIQNLSQLEELNISYNNIKELPKGIYNLPNLKLISLNDNPNLKTKIIFGGKLPFHYCDFNNVTIICYKSHTCDQIKYDNINLDDTTAHEKLNICTIDDIQEFLNQSENKNSFSFIILGDIIIGIIVGIFVTLFIIKIKKTGFKRHKKSNFNSDEFRSGSIRVLLRNNNSYNLNIGINNDNNNNNQYGNLELLDLQKPPPSYNNSIMKPNIKNKDKNKVYNGSTVEDDEPLIPSDSKTKDETLLTVPQLMTEKMKYFSENKKFD